MINFSIERSLENKQYYAQFTADQGEIVWNTLPEYYTRKEKAKEAIFVLANHFESDIVIIEDHTIFPYKSREYRITKEIEKINKAKAIAKIKG